MMSRPMFATTLFASTAAPVWVDGASELWAGTVFVGPDDPDLAPTLPVTLNLTLWLDASDASTLFQDAAGTVPVNTDSDPIGMWADKSGGSHHVTQATGSKQPLYIAGADNGKPAVRFDGLGDTMSTASLTYSALFGADAATVYAVHRHAGVFAAAPYSLRGANNANRIISYLPYGTGAIIDYGDNNSGGRITGELPPGYGSALAVAEVYRSGSAGAVSVNGAQAFSGTFTDALDTSDTGAFWLASVFDLEGYVEGDMVELIVFNRALDAGERAAITAYLMNKWAIA